MPTDFRKPRFHLERVYSDGSRDEPEILRLADIDGCWHMGRRAFLVTTTLTVAALAALQGCSKEKEADELTATGEEQPGAPWISAAGTCDPTIKVHDSMITALAFSPDGTMLATGSLGAIKLWQLPSNEIFKTLKSSGTTVLSLAFSPDGRFLASGSNDKTIVVWEVSKGIQAKTLNGHTEGVISVAFSPDGTLLASGSLDKTLRLWDPSTGKLKDTLVRKKGLIYMFTKGHDAQVNAVCFSPDGMLLASGSADGTIMLWKAPSGSRIATLEAGKVTGLAFSADGRYLLSGTESGNFKVWRMNALKVPKLLTVSLQKVRSVAAFSPLGDSEKDAPSAGSLTSDGTIRLWKVPPGALQRAVYCGESGSDTTTGSVAFASDGSLFAAGSSDGAVRLWDLHSGRFLTCLYDPATLKEDKKVGRYEYTNQYGQRTSSTLPCGSPIPPGAICTCNCVPGAISIPKISTGGGTICTCNKICTCVPIK